MSAKSMLWIFLSIFIMIFLCSCNTIISAFMPGTAPIHKAAQAGNVMEVKAILQDSPSQVNRQDEWGCTPLMYAAGYAHVNVVKLLIESGAKINQKCRKGSSTLDRVKSNIRTCRNIEAEIIDLQKQNPKADIDKFRERFSSENLKKWEEILVILNEAFEQNTVPLKNMNRFFMTSVFYTSSTDKPYNIDDESRNRYIKENLDWKKLEPGSFLQWQYFAQYIIFPKGSKLQIKTSFCDGTDKQEILDSIKFNFPHDEYFFRHTIEIEKDSIVESFTARATCVMLAHRRTLLAETVVTGVKGEIMASNISVSSKNSAWLIDEALDFYVHHRVICEINVLSGETTVYKDKDQPRSTPVKMVNPKDIDK